MSQQCVRNDIKYSVAYKNFVNICYDFIPYILNVLKFIFNDDKKRFLFIIVSVDLRYKSLLYITCI